ncbi:WD40 repeat-like protein [Fistulina hepatica ATCC 64428]|nr:WD40 repeat-like protein [Fistulina hepatica ATCC 64428]
MSPGTSAGTSSGISANGAHTNGVASTVSTNGTFANGAVTNGTSTSTSNGIGKAAPPPRTVLDPTATLYDDSDISRVEFVRLVLQTLRDLGYSSSADTLEAESGYELESPDASNFRKYILEASWDAAEHALTHLGVDHDALWQSKLLIRQQKYLELLEDNDSAAALKVLRNELAPLNVEPNRLHLLSSYLMCSNSEDLRERAQWQGGRRASRQRLMEQLHSFIPSSIIIPPRRLDVLFHQSRSWQIAQCLYHNMPSLEDSLFTDHRCDKSALPQVTTAVLVGHEDEVWNLAWSHDGRYLATCGRDKTVIVWTIGTTSNPSTREMKDCHILRDHPDVLGCVSWSPDDSILLASGDSFIKMWDPHTGAPIKQLGGHSDTVTALAWLPHGREFFSAGLDKKIILWDSDGMEKEVWSESEIRIVDLAVTPDQARLIAVGINALPPPPDFSLQPRNSTTPATLPDSINEYKVVVYKLATKEIEQTIRMSDEMTSVKISANSQFALVNHAPDEIQLLDLVTGRKTRTYTGQHQGRDVIRSCFGGLDGRFVVSGSEETDAKVYMWHTETGAQLQILSGHGEGSVNAVAWNPTNERMFASCSDDRTIRIWEPIPSSSQASYPVLSSSAKIAPSSKDKGKTRQLWDDGVGTPSSRV